MNVRGWIIIWFHLGLGHSVMADAGQVFFHNGDALTGELVGMESSEGRLQWSYPNSSKPFDFEMDAISHILLHRAPAMTGHSNPLFKVSLTNGDSIRGVINEMNAEHLILEAGLAQPLHIPREHVVQIESALNASQLLYQGPNQPGEWAVGYRGKNWILEDGRLVSESYSSTGRELKIPQKARVAMDVSLRDDPTLNVFLCADNPRNGGDSYYYLQLTRNVINCKRYWRDHPRTYIDLTKEFENKEIRNTFLGQPQVHLAVEIDREAKRLKLFVNGQLYASYRDPAPKAPAGSSIIFSSYGNGAVRVGDIRVHALENLSATRRTLALRQAVFQNGDSFLGELSIANQRVSAGDRSAPLATLTAARLAIAPDPSTPLDIPTFFLASGGTLRAHARLLNDSLEMSHPLLGELSLPLSMLDGWLSNAKEAPTLSKDPDVAHFKNGDRLAGTLLGWDDDQGLRWQWGKSLLRFPSRALAEVRHRPNEARADPRTILHLSSGDALPGTVQSMTPDEMIYGTAFSNPMHIPMPVVTRMAFEDPSNIYFRGPGQLDHWKRIGSDAKWSINANGEFAGRGMGGLAQGVPLPERGRIDFEIGWVGQLDLSITLFARDLTRVVQPKTYRLHCENEQISLYRGLSEDEVAAERDDEDPLRNRRLTEQLERFSAQFGGGASRRMGSPVQVRFKTFQRSRKITLCWDQEASLLALLVDGEIARVWEDPHPLTAAAGSGLVLNQHNQTTKLRLLSLRVQGWNGVLPDPPLSDKAVKALENTVVRLRNQDEFLVQTLALAASDAPLTFESELGPLALPMDRLEFLQFPNAKYPIKHQLGLVVDAHLYPEGQCRSFLTKIEDGQMHVSSPYFGENVFTLASFRKLVFDLQDRAYWDRQTVPWPRPIPVSMRHVLQTRQTEREESLSRNDGSKFDESVEFDE